MDICSFKMLYLHDVFIIVYSFIKKIPLYFINLLKIKIMPRGNQTGPMGQGHMTGRSLGFYSGYDSPGYKKDFRGGMGKSFGRGNGRGMGFGRGRRFGFANNGFFQGLFRMPSMSKNDEISVLKSQAEELKRSQETREKRLNELTKESE
jgi:hypothetical protein